MSINFKPSQNEYDNIGSFRFWCQKVIPLVYEDSLSYYELLSNVVKYLNETIKNVGLMGEDMQKLYTSHGEFVDSVDTKYNEFTENVNNKHTAFINGINKKHSDFVDKINEDMLALTSAYNTLKQYVDNYFDNLDIQNEIDDKLDRLVENGVLPNIIELIVNKHMKIYVTPEMFGAVGDGVTDDSDAIIEALNSDKVVLFMGNYGISKELQGTAQKIVGVNATFNVLNDVDRIFKLPNTFYVDGLTFDCKNKGVTQCLSLSNKNVEVSNIEIFNVMDMRSDKGSELIFCVGNENVNIHNVYVHDCFHIISGGVGDTAGNISCIYVGDYTGICSIENVNVKEIHNINANGDFVMEDGGGIYVRTLNKNASTFIRNIKGYNYCKRLIKTQCANTITIDGINAYSNAEDVFVCIGIQSTESEEITEQGHAFISNCVIVNDYVSNTVLQLGIATSEKVVVDKCKFVFASQFAIQNTGDMEITNTHFYGNAIIHLGRVLKVDNIVFEGGVFLYGTHSNSEMEKTIIQNAELTYKETLIQYPQFEIQNGEFELSNIVSNGINFMLASKGVVKNAVARSSTGDNFVISDDVEMQDIILEAYQTDSIMRGIHVYEEGTLVIENLKSKNVDYTIVFKGNVTLKGGVDISKLLGVNQKSFSNYPEYVDTLPTATTIPNGAIVILMTDNKMYKYTNNSWNVV